LAGGTVESARDELLMHLQTCQVCQQNIGRLNRRPGLSVW
jgi:hypothetical protein